MESTGNRLWNLVRITVAAIGLVISLFILIKAWQLRQPVTDSLTAGLDMFASTLDATSDTLTTFQQTLDSTDANLDYLDQLAQTMSQSVHDTTPALDSLKKLTGKDLPTTLQSTEKSLNAAQASAKTIDDMLSGLSHLPFMPVTPYEPQTPLNSALGQITNSLDALSPSLSALNDSLNTASGNLLAVESQTKELSRNIRQIKSNITQIRRVVSQYQQTTIQARNQVRSIRSALPGWVTAATAAFSFIILWLIVTQVDLLIRALGLGRQRTVKERPIS
jgi:methyl-accepting chemotaxis protein